jgi:hypothetical protein
MNMVVCTELPPDGIDMLVGNALTHFRSMNIGRLSWLARHGGPAMELKNQLVIHGLKFKESFAIEMAADLMKLTENHPMPEGFKIIQVEDKSTLEQWIHVASTGFGVPATSESTWCDIFFDAVLEQPFRTYLALLDGKPVATSQLFLSAGVAGIYNVTCLPEAREQGVGTAITLIPLLEARRMKYRIGILQASKMGYKIYQRLGFQEYGKLSVYLWERELM